MIVLVMGVCGSGKSTIGRALADRLGWKFADADDFHSEQNVIKMKSGQSLNDEDRRPWLLSIHQFMKRSITEGTNAVVTCSALKQLYRDVLIHGETRESCPLYLFGALNDKRTNSEDAARNSVTNRESNTALSTAASISEDTAAISASCSNNSSNHDIVSSIADSAITNSASTSYKSVKEFTCIQEVLQDFDQKVNRCCRNGDSCNASTDSDTLNEECSRNILNECRKNCIIKEELNYYPSYSSNLSNILVVYLKGTRDVIEKRMKARENHFMPVSLLESQMEVLEEPSIEDGEVLTVDIDQSVEDILNGIISNMEIRN